MMRHEETRGGRRRAARTITIRLSGLRSAALVAALLAAAAPAAARQQEAPPAAPPPATQPDAAPSETFSEVIDVRVVNVEVVVTDRSGERVTGLTPESFRLRVDGEPVPITYFSEVVDGVARSTDRLAVTAAPEAADGVVGSSYLVYIDDTWVIARDRDRVLASLSAELALLGPDDRVAVLAFDGSKVDLLSGWSDSPEELRRALDAAADRRAGGVRRMAELRSHDSPAGGISGRSATRGIVQELSTEDRFFAQQVAHQVERSVAGAVAALRGFARPPGRKVMLLLTGGWPFSPAAYAANQWAALADGSVDDGRELMRPLIDTANLLGYTIYPVDVPGLQPLGGVGPDVEMAADGTLPTASSDRERIGEESLHWIARATGGEALINAERRAPLATVKADTRSYYWLGFSPQRQGSDDRHDITVEVTRPGVRVRSRTSFLDLSPATEREMAVESLLLFGEGQQAGGLYVEVGESRPRGRRQVLLPLRIGIPTDFVTLMPNTAGDRWTVRLELRVGALDERRRESDVPSVPLEITFSERPPAGQLIPYSTELSLRRAEQVLVITVTDAVSGESLSARATFDP